MADSKNYPENLKVDKMRQQAHKNNADHSNKKLHDLNAHDRKVGPVKGGK